jgi:two-component system chemotaxis response regulator CheY
MIHFLREYQQITQQEFARYMDVSEQTIAKWESGQTSPNINDLPRIANFFCVTIDFLFNCDIEELIHEYQRSHEKENRILLSDNNASMDEVLEYLCLKHPGDIKLKKEFIRLLCKKNDLSLLDKIFNNIIELIRINESINDYDDVLIALKAFLRNAKVINPENETMMLSMSSDTYEKMPELNADQMKRLVKEIAKNQLSKLKDLSNGILSQEDINHLSRILAEKDALEKTKEEIQLLSQADIDKVFNQDKKSSSIKANGKNILIVDDVQIMRTFLREILESEGYSVVGEARDGQEGFALAMDLRPDIIFMDIGMPVMDGLEASAKILVHFPNMPIIIVSALCNFVSVHKAFRIGVVGFVCKPFTPDRIVEEVHKVSFI